MDYEEKKKRRLVRVLVAEIGMAVSVLALVVVTTLLAMGFFISSDGQIEQSGLLQLHSLPTGATVELDGETLFARTNLSRTMSAEEHNLKLSRDGYDTWEKTISMYSGALIRLYYPRLFLQNRKPEMVAKLNFIKFADDLEFFVPSRSRNYIIYAVKGETNWHLWDLRGDEPKETILDLAKVLPGVVSATPKARNEAPNYHFTGTVEDLVWSSNDERALIKVKLGEKIQWVLVDLRNPKQSLNLSETFGLEFDQVKIIDESASRLFALENQQLRRISVSDGVISRVLIGGIEEFENRGSSVIYVTKDAIGVYRDGEDGTTLIKKLEDAAPVKVALARYYDEDYICYVLGQELTVLYGKLPSYKKDGEADLGDLKTLVEGMKLAALPQSLSVSGGGEYVVAQNGQQLMVVDLDRGDLYEYGAGTAEWRWLDDSMMYTVLDGTLKVWDFDGTNQRELSEGLAERPVMITGNNRWLYYLSEDLAITREKIRD